MPKSSAHQEFLPPQALVALAQLGGNLALARRRRKEPLRAWAQRIGVSVRTLQRLERGDPGVGMGVYAAALWLLGRANALPQLADPALDQGALQLDVREAAARYAPRAAAQSAAQAATQAAPEPASLAATRPAPRATSKPSPQPQPIAAVRAKPKQKPERLRSASPKPKQAGKKARDG